MENISSVKRTLTFLLSKKTNKMCADCRSALVDPLLVHASFTPSLDEISENSQVTAVVALHDFLITHHAFAPPSNKKDRSRFGSDPARFVNQTFGGHGVFICAKCAEAHRCLGESIAIVLPALESSSEWTSKRAQFMKDCGGNARSWEMYEGFMPEKWKQRRPKPSSTQEDRILFIRAKYEALAFTMPPPGKLADDAWLSILEQNEIGKRFKSSMDLKNIHSLTPSGGPMLSKIDTTNGKSVPALMRVLPNRLIDFFCVVSCSMQLHPTELKKDLSTLTSPEQLIFRPHVSDCYPEKDTYREDTEFPTHLPNFVLPEGCRPMLAHTTPKFFTFILTTGEGDRLYGGALEIHDSTVTTGELRDIVLNSGYKGALPNFIERAEDTPELAFFSKSLVLLSHYPFYDLFRTCLKQLNMITLVEAPLPIERYIANVCREVPLPPQGRIKVEFSFTPDKVITIERPPWNQLPLANFSYRPLFSSLSIGNIMIVLGCLMEECKIVLLSQYYSMLCPSAEALLSALFPFEWQGLYIPIMPYAMLDILDCPVPFLVGLNSRYLTEIDPKRRPRDLVYVDLDRDVVQLGYDEETGYRRKIPNLPFKDASKLRTALETNGGSAYMLPISGIKGCVMSGISKMILVTNDERPMYARMENVQIDEDSLGRKDVFEQTDKAYDETKDMAEIHTLGHLKSDDETNSVLSNLSGDTSMQPKIRIKMKMKMKPKPVFVSRKKQRKNILLHSNVARGQGHLLDMVETSGFNSAEIRKAFLRFFVSIFMDYEDFLLVDQDGGMFDDEGFLKSLGFDPYELEFISRVINTQMFQRFLEERQENPMDPEIRFFDESIIAKLNRSAKAKVSKKFTTPFLDDKTNDINKTFISTPPSNLGIPDNDTVYQYGTFPSLDKSLFGRIRPATVWRQEQSFDSLRQSSRPKKLSKAQKTQRDIMKEAMKPMSSDRGAVVKDLDSALSILSSRVGFMNTHKHRRGDKKTEEMESSKGSKVFDSLPESIVIPISESDTIIINARRKQAILLDIIIKLQAICRMFLVRKKHGFDTNSGYKGRKFRAAITIQKHTRRLLEYKQFKRFRECAIIIQKQIRSRRSRFIYEMILELVSKVQARCRGFLIRKRVALVLADRMKLYREQIFSLWKAAFVPLSFRTKLWPTFNGESFARLRLCQAEIIRVLQIVDLDVDLNNSLLFDSTTQAGDSLGIDNEVYCISKHLSVVLKERVVEKTPAYLQTFEGFEQAERLQLYDRLDSKSFANDVGKIYDLFNVPSREKKKKQYLAQIIWNNFNEVDSSVSTMMLVFPELEGSLNIAFHDPSSKSRRRFNKACKVTTPLVERNVWNEASLEGISKKHMQEVARIYITKVPTLMAKLDEADKRKNTKWKTTREASMKASGESSWERCRHKLISGYLWKRTEHTPLLSLDSEDVGVPRKISSLLENEMPSFRESSNGSPSTNPFESPNPFD